MPYELEIDPLAVSLTKSVTKLGVPLLAFYTSVLVCLMAWMFSQSFGYSTSLMSSIPFVVMWSAMYLSMYFVQMKDSNGLQICWINFLHFNRPKSYSFWQNLNSYAP